MHLASVHDEVTYEVGMARAYVLQGLLPGEMLRAGSNVQSPIFVNIGGVVAYVIGIVVIGDRVKDIYIDAVNGTDYLHKAIKAHTGIVVDVDAEILGNGQTAESYTTQRICLVQLMHDTIWHVDPAVTRYLQHSYLCDGR